MTESERKSLMTLICEREEIAYKRLKGNIRYSEICSRQNATEEMVEKLYQRFKKKERIAIRRHYEGETEKGYYEVNEVYIQGFKDCFNLIIHLGLLSD